jgi:hypothetical protein
VQAREHVPNRGLRHISDDTFHKVSQKAKLLSREGQFEHSYSSIMVIPIMHLFRNYLLTVSIQLSGKSWQIKVIPARQGRHLSAVYKFLS